MANNITLFKKYIDLLDEVYKQASLTSVLDSDGALAQQGANANEIIIPKISMDGLADYSRSGGYTAGDITLTNETVKFNYDRGRKFTVDAMDNEETMGVAFGKLASEFIRTQVVPELDAFRFATVSGKEGIGVKTGTLANGSAVIEALRESISVQDEAEVPMENRYLFITPTLYGMIQDLDTNKSREALNRFAQIIQVPQTRFYTAVKLNDGKTAGEIAGGFEKAADGAEINFIVISKPALMQYTKHTVTKTITPEQNQDSDGYMFFYRSYGLTDVYENKVKGIYLNHKGA